VYYVVCRKEKSGSEWKEFFVRETLWEAVRSLLRHKREQPSRVFEIVRDGVVVLRS